MLLHITEAVYIREKDCFVAHVANFGWLPVADPSTVLSVPIHAVETQADAETYCRS